MVIRWCSWHKPRWLGFMGFAWWGWKYWFKRTDGICDRCAGKIPY